ncbi:MAG: uroporphyrinogen-III synthase [Caldilinea sp.]|nr:uroporphyrinogen-III synthase [Caldilineaceae bacterium]MCB9121660.1 uroporphyrinogen-III synthase [Caldilineaceae bacterium]MCB9124507.1 uroporphyrinogen-III synthase [Caldilineaceae bacterium]MCO5211558.1 uroporphyrinogen-III synthase [Caldilinea sp.]MCW5842331.1 uroporphyrinogen-III synthase [Caldilinea sp.]
MSQNGLRGRRVVVTQAEHQAPALIGLLEARGATALPYPCIAIVPPADIAPLDECLQRLAGGAFDWLVLTSANGVRIVAERLDALAIAPDRLDTLRIATVGAATAEAVQAELGLPVALVPDEQVAEGLAAALAAAMQPNARVLLPQAELARSILAEQLATAGARVTQVVAYRTVRGTGGVDLPALLAAGAVDAVTLTSSSTFRNLLARLASPGSPSPSSALLPGDLLSGVCLACIGPVTAETVRAAGFDAAVVAADQSLEGLVAALEAYFQSAHAAALPLHRSEELL